MKCQAPRLALAGGLLALTAVFGLRAEVVVQEQRRHYLLDASTLPLLAVQLQASGSDAASGRRSHGLTEAGIETRYELNPRVDGRCALRQIRVKVQLIQTLPDWKPAQPPPEGMAARVSRMLDGLASHEIGHRRHVLDTASSIDRKLSALSVAESCERARRAAERVVSRELIRLRVGERNYDLATDRGRRQGAVLELESPSPRPRPGRQR